MNIYSDRERFPLLFQFGLGSAQECIQAWEAENEIVLPEEVRDLWTVFGSGTIFETEDVFCLRPDPITEEDVNTVTSVYRCRGLPMTWWVLHRGLGGLTVLDGPSRKIHQVNEFMFETSHTYLTLNSWYTSGLRMEYADRYGLGE